MNFGHGELGFAAWPRVKSSPVAEYCTVLRVSTPMVLEALPMTAFASCAEGVHTSTTNSPKTAKDFLNMLPPCLLFTASGRAGVCARHPAPPERSRVE